MRIINQTTKIKKNRIAAFAAWLGISIGSLVIAVGLFLHLPQVQNKLFSNLIQRLNDKTQFHIQHKQFRFSWFHQILLTGLSVKDPNNELVCSISQLKLHINPFNLLWRKDLVINYIEAKDGKLLLIQNKEAQRFNVQILLDRLADDASSTNTSLDNKDITISKATLSNFSFLVDDQTRPTIAGFDPHHIHLESITAELSKFHYGKDTCTGNLQNFAGYDLTQELGIQQLQGKFQFTPKVSAVKGLHVATAYSHLQGHFTLAHQGLAALIQAPHQAQLTAQIDDLKLDTQELAPFLPYLKGHNTTYKLKSKITGKLNDISIEGFQVAFGQHSSYLGGFAKIQGLPVADEISFSVEITEGALYTEDLFIHIPQQHHNTLQKMNFCSPQATITGTLHSLVANCRFTTDIGKVATNLAIQIDKNTHHIGYQGEITTTDLDVGKLLGLPDLGEVTLDTHIDGQGMDLANANLYIKTFIQNLRFHKYDYKNIRVNGRLAQSLFKGHASIEDPYIMAHLTAQINLHSTKKAILVDGILSSLNANKLGIISQPFQASSEINIALQGETWDELTGSLNLKRSHILFNNKPLAIKDIYMAMGKKESGKFLVFNSDLLDIQAEGIHTYTALVHDLQTFVHTYQHHLLQNGSTYNPAYTHKPYKLSYEINIKNTNPLLQIITPATYVAPNASIHGSFAQELEEVKLELHVAEKDSLQFANQELEGIYLDIIAHHPKAGTSIFATSQLSANKHTWKDHISTDHLLVNINCVDDEILFQSTIGNAVSPLQYSLAGKAYLRNAGLYINFHDAFIRLADKTWNLDPTCKIFLKSSEIQCHDMIFSCQDQQIALEGKWSSAIPEKLIIRATNVLISSFSLFITKPLEGIINGTLAMAKRPDQPMVQGDIQVHKIKMGDLSIGDLYAQATWNKHAQHMKIACQLKQAEKQLMHIAGLYMPNHATQTLDLTAEFSHAQLALLEPFVESVCSRLEGEVHGNLLIKGSFQNPMIHGKAAFENLILQFKHLKAVYQGYGNINCSSNKINVEKLYLADSQEGYMNFHGKICYQSLQDITLDLSGKMHQVEVLNTKHDDSPYFYGKGVVTGNIRLTGPAHHMDVYANLVTKKGTSLIIPIRKHNKKAEQEEFIHFVAFKDNPFTSLPASLPSMQLEELNLHINLEITPDALAEIMFNGKDGDIIQGKGKGNLTIQSDSNGNLSMSGSYELVEGSYSFSVYKKVVSKKFKILPGSSISWIDKPYDGVLHVKATYEQHAYLTPLLGTKIVRDEKKFPIQVVLGLEGTLAEPDIHFDVQFLQLPENHDLQEAITTFQEKAITDSDYLKNQVFSLVMFKAFSSGNKVSLSGNTLQRSMGELFSQQLSSIAGSLDENLEIDTDLDLSDIMNTGMNVEKDSQEKIKSLPIRISYNLWDGRLIISRKSKMNFATGKEINFGNVVGAWSIAYGLTHDNRLRIKLHGDPSGSESHANMSGPILGAISLAYVKSFNNWRELFLKAKLTHQK